MSTTTVTTVASETFGEQYGAVGVEDTSWRLHVAALKVLKKAGKLTYTDSEYCLAVDAARRELDLPDVHSAMAGRPTYV